MPVGPPGFRASVVRVVDFRKEEYLDRHQPHSRAAASKRPFLLLLSPDTLQLATAGDATDAAPPATVPGALLQAASLKPERSMRGPSIRPLALLHKLGGHGSSSAAPGDGDPSGRHATPEGAESRLLLEDGEPLEEGQLITFSIALSQVVGIEHDGCAIKVLFGRQRPHRSSRESSDDWKAVMKYAILPFGLPIEGWKHKNYKVDAYLNRHRRDPFVSSVTFEADTPQEAAALRASLEEAIARLGQAVAWLAKELPLNDRPVVTLVTTTTTAAPEPAAPDSPAGSPAPFEKGPLCARDEQIVCTFPRPRQPLEIAAPPPAAAAAGAGAAADEPAGQLEVHVWLHSPLGPAVATITEEQLRRSADAGGAPVSVVATPHEHEEAPAPLVGQDKLEVVLQFTAARPLARSPSRLHSHPRQPGAAAAAGSTTGSSGSSSGTIPMLAVLAVPLLAAWLQLFVAGGTPAAGVLQWVAFLVSSLGAIVGIVVLQLARMRAPAPAPAAQQEAAPLYWRLVLLHADLVSETRRRAGAPPVQRVVSSSLTVAPSAPAPALDGAPVELPPPIRRLVAQHPSVLTEDVAARFVVGLGTADKAYTGLKNMVDWVEAQGVADLVRQPQPRFQLIKQHYPQGFYCWSTRSDCVLEVEATGRWREAYDALRAAGVTEQELLRHQFFCMEYAFKVLDTRPLPQGKTVKIIDLEGLCMRDVGSTAFKWYLQVGGALLAVNYPQRLHKAFLLNAPTWSGVIWKVLAAVIPRRTREQLMLFTKKQKEAAAEALLQWVPPEQLPAQYGGKCAVPLGESPLERDMARYVERLNAGAARAAAQAAAVDGGAQAAQAAGGGGSAQAAAGGGGGSAQATRSPFA